MTDKDPNYIPKLEKAIAQKYGQEAIDNPRKFWDEEKEQEYIKQSREFKKRHQKINEQKEKVEQHGFLINKKLLSKDNNRTCPVCKKYSFRPQDDLYLNKFECCFVCYVQWIEDREERWKSGWRPNEGKE
tara:strand:+ start:3726 stop:4115 length:390 start_codon:yes stop_codon:yes gene_type:complete